MDLDATLHGNRERLKNIELSKQEEAAKIGSEKEQLKSAREHLVPIEAKLADLKRLRNELITLKAKLASAQEIKLISFL